MSPALLLKVLITTSTTLALAAIAWFARKYPNRSKQYPERVRMPKLVPIVGWLFLGIGLLMGLTAFSWRGNDIGPLIASAAICAGGLGLVLMYRNFYVAPRRYEVAFRSVLGKEHVLPYSEITRYNMQSQKGQQFLAVRFASGAKLSLNISAYDTRPLLRAIDFHRATGRWPVPADAPAPAARLSVQHVDPAPAR